MTTPKPYHTPAGTVTFARPTVGPRVYLTTGPSGWPETFKRATADRRLEEFLDPVEIDDAITTFAESVRLQGRDETWEDVTRHLSEVTHQPQAEIPREVAVAFWGQYTLYIIEEGSN